MAGLALAFSVGSYIHLYILYLFLQRKYADICATALFVSMGKIVLTSILMGLFVWLSVEITSTYFSTTSLIGTLSQISISCIIGALTYLGFSFILGIEEMGWAFRRRINGKSSGSLGEAEVS
ncbi:MAG: hypothetical protein BWY68_00653 [bacterium ADurb.Bin400]|nr:MAG: hypothetical protein BWY68_00653 [bacterium ADurb.Bin400]